ncbi:MAG: amino acid--tRNA ligase-related protein, partial [Gammaproteobacteria bacterium]|nr:amino acid--tRNA ligase-related protein [Gammaproteobacteria bacterium]
MHKFLLTAGLILISVNVFAENLYYIYKDNKGRTFIEDTVTPNHAKYGYRIVNSQGATLQVVPGTLEKQREEKKRLAHKKTKKPHKKEHSKDEYLLRTFVDEEDIFQIMEKYIQRVFREIINFEVQRPFPRLTYNEAMEKYGSDKPDLRYGLQIEN